MIAGTPGNQSLRCGRWRQIEHLSCRLIRVSSSFIFKSFTFLGFQPHSPLKFHTYSILSHLLADKDTMLFKFACVETLQNRSSFNAASITKHILYSLFAVAAADTRCTDVHRQHCAVVKYHDTSAFPRTLALRIFFKQSSPEMAWYARWVHVTMKILPRCLNDLDAECFQ
jgi:hypothetical protein